MIEAKLDDGRVLEFPDGTPPEVVQDTVRRILGIAAAPPIPEPIQPDLLEGRTPGAVQLSGAAKTVDDAVRSLAQVPTFGFADEAAALGNAALGRGTVSGNLAEESARDKTIPSEVSIPTQVAGSLALGATALPNVVSTGTRVIPALLRGAGVGAAAGAASGAGFAEGGLRSRAVGAGRGAAFGGALGAASVPVTAAIGAGVRRLQPSASRATGRALKKIEQAFERDQVTPARAAARSRTLGPLATVADVGGRNVRRLARGVTASPGAAERLAGSTLEGRALSQPSRVAQAVNRIRGGRDFAESVDDIIDVRKRNANELYDAAFDTARSSPGRGRLTGNEITELIEDSPRIRGAIRQAREFSEFSGLPDNSIEVLDQAYKNLGGAARAVNREGNPVLANNMRREASRLLDAIDDEVPGYRRAVEVFSDDSSLLDALTEGRRFLRQDSGATRRLIEDMTDGERELFTVGVGQALEDLAGKVKSGSDITRKLFATPEIRGKIRAALPNDRQFRQFQSTMLREAEFGQTRNAVLSGSRTTPLAEDVADLAAPVQAAISATQAATVGGTTGLAFNLIGQAGRRLSGSDSGRLPEPVRDEIARLLLSAGGPQAVGNLSREAQRAATARALQRVIGLEGSFVAGQQSGAALAPQQSQPRRRFE